MPPERQAAMLEVVRAKLTLAIASPEKLVAQLGANDAKADGKSDGSKGDGSKGAGIKGGRIWEQARNTGIGQVQRLQAGIRNAYADRPDVSAQIERAFAPVGRIFDDLGNELSTALDEFADTTRARDPRAAAQAKQKAAQLRAAYVTTLRSQAGLIAELDNNPFGVALDLQKTLADGLRAAGQALQ
jgi:hypothetical protein